MEKIFEPAVEEYLLETGVTEEQIQKIKYDKLKDAALKRLFSYFEMLTNDKYDEIIKSLADSGAGDGYGQDNKYINFGYIVGQDTMDIGELCEMLKQLKPR